MMMVDAAGMASSVLSMSSWARAWPHSTYNVPLPIPVQMPLAHIRDVPSGGQVGARAERAVPRAVAAPAATTTQRGGLPVRRPSSAPAAKSAMTTAEADTTHEGSALMPTPARSGYTANVS